MGDTQTLVIQTDGTVLLAPSETYYSSGLLTPLTSGLASDTFLFRDNSGTTWLYGYNRMEDLDINDPAVSSLPLVFATRKSMTAIQTAVEHLMSQLRLIIGVSAIAVTILVLVLGFLLFRPLGRLTQAAITIGQGNLTEPVPQFPPDEIGRLSQALSQVVGQLTGRLDQLRAVVEVSHSTGLTLDTDKMLAETAQAISKQLNFTEVRIFLSDLTGKNARLRAAFGGESEHLLRSGFHVAVDETTVVGRSILLNEPVIVGGKGALREAGAVPGHSEMVLPLQMGGETVGALHLITNRTREFNREDIDVLRLLTDQLGASIQNARLFEQSAANLAEIEALNRRLTRQAWEEYMGEGGTMRHTLDPDGQWPQVIAEARQSTEIKAEVYTDADGRLVLAAPLILRGEAVGTLAVTRPAGETWTRDEALLLESIASRMGIIAESIRLVEASTRHVEREQRVNEVSANLLQRASSVDTVLRSALTELSGALGSDRVALRIGGLPARDGRQITAGLTEEQSNDEVAPESSDDPEARDTDGDEGMISQ
jgi:GAF domain-containing protein